MTLRQDNILDLTDEFEISLVVEIPENWTENQVQELQSSISQHLEHAKVQDFGLSKEVQFNDFANYAGSENIPAKFLAAEYTCAKADTSDYICEISAQHPPLVFVLHFESTYHSGEYIILNGEIEETTEWDEEEYEYDEE